MALSAKMLAQAKEHHKAQHKYSERSPPSLFNALSNMEI